VRNEDEIQEVFGSLLAEDRRTSRHTGYLLFYKTREASPERVEEKIRNEEQLGENVRIVAVVFAASHPHHTHHTHHTQHTHHTHTWMSSCCGELSLSFLFFIYFVIPKWQLM